MTLVPLLLLAVPDEILRLLNSLGDIATRACSNAETWVQEADFLRNYYTPLEQVM